MAGSPRALLASVSFLHSRTARRVYLVAACTLPLLIALASWIDGTLSMSEPAKGLSQHYGFWAIFLTTPVLILLTAYLYDLFVKHIERPATYCVELTDEMSGRLNDLVTSHVES